MVRKFLLNCFYLFTSNISILVSNTVTVKSQVIIITHYTLQLNQQLHRSTYYTLTLLLLPLHPSYDICINIYTYNIHTYKYLHICIYTRIIPELLHICNPQIFLINFLAFAHLLQWRRTKVYYKFSTNSL